MTSGTSYHFPKPVDSPLYTHNVRLRLYKRLKVSTEVHALDPYHTNDRHTSDRNKMVPYYLYNENPYIYKDSFRCEMGLDIDGLFSNLVCKLMFKAFPNDIIIMTKSVQYFF